jgi:dienelactone hydrolase
MRTASIGVLLLCLLALAGCGGGGSKDDSTAASNTAQAITPADVAFQGHLFSYDRFTTPIDLKDNGVVNPGYPIAVHDVSYLTTNGSRVTAYLVVPPGEHKHPGVIYLHGSGGSRLDLLVQATWMAARGAVCLVVDSAFARAGTPDGTGFEALAQQRDLENQNIIDLRRGIDVLTSLPYVNDRKLGFVGWSAGAKSGAILAGVDHRIRSFVLISGGSSPVSAYTKLAAKDQRAALGALLRQTDPLRYVAHAAPSALLIQDGTKDKVVPHAALLALANAASKPKDVRWYPSGHPPSNRMWHDSLRWLSKRLGLGAPNVPGAKTGP